MRLHAKWVLPIDAPPIENGVVEITGDTITAVGQLAGPNRDLGDVVFLPGLINAHCHFDYTQIAVPYRESFTEWIRRKSKADTRRLSGWDSSWNETGATRRHHDGGEY